jgi:hypothetical protein
VFIAFVVAGWVALSIAEMLFPVPGEGVRILISGRSIVDSILLAVVIAIAIYLIVHVAKHRSFGTGILTGIIGVITSGILSTIYGLVSAPTLPITNPFRTATYVIVATEAVGTVLLAFGTVIAIRRPPSAESIAVD